MQESDWVRPWGHWQRKCVVIIQMMQSVAACTGNLKSCNNQYHHTMIIVESHNSNVVEKMISIYKRMASEALLGRITHGKTQKPNESLNSIHKLNSIRNDWSSC